MESKALCFIAYNRPDNKYSLNVIAGALESAFTPQDVEILFASKSESLTSAIDEASQLYRKTVVGWSLHSPQFVESSAELHTLKSRTENAEVVHLAGGPHPTAEPKQTLRAGFDAVAVGEGEKTIIEFFKRLLNGENCLHINGMAYLSGGRFVSNGSGERIELDDYPPFAPRHRHFNPIEITRGCVYACRFCQTPFMFKARFRHRSIDNICYYVKVMKDHGLKDIRFITPTALSYGSLDSSVNLSKIEELLASVRATVGDKGRIFFGTFPSEVRPEHVSREALVILKKYVNNNNLIIGAQSGSQRVLDLSHRGHTVEDIVSAVKISLDVGFIPNVDFIFGLPGERPSDIRASLRLIEEFSAMGARIHGHTFMPLPGTPFKNESPGIIDARTMRRYRRLVARGKLYGDWEKQIEIAQELVRHDALREQHEN
ncbi:MAG: TIGR04013 family B12-binding domain/radical SAM domain-containing protein [Chloroflexi bacterium]|nr:TIGR04013 family B12-binding domain/radical SAM domain-containing protein [Chloroflexota bacterium]